MTEIKPRHDNSSGGGEKARDSSMRMSTRLFKGRTSGNLISGQHERLAEKRAQLGEKSPNTTRIDRCLEEVESEG